MNYEEANKAIRNAWVVGVIAGVMTLIMTLIYASGVEVSRWDVLDIVLIFGFTLGVYKKSRTCAILLFAYFIGSKIWLSVQSGILIGLPLAAIFGYYFFQGIRGTFAYHNTMTGKTNVA